jgi:uncharacterized membrane protein SpoIIM required for sporulation
MVLEAILNSKQIEHKPILMLLYSIIVTTISLWTAKIIFPSAQSIVFIFFISIALIPIFYKILQDTEENDEIIGNHINLTFFEKHENILKIYLFFFLGIIIAASFWYTILPTETTNEMFKYEITTLKDLRGNYDCNIHNYKECTFLKITLNNLKILLFCFTISFFFGTGAIFILTWNASVIGVFIGDLAKSSLTEYNSILISYITSLPIGIGSILLHGLPEIGAYCIGGLAGGILSIAIIQGKKPECIIKDSTILMILAIFIIILAAILEVYITPLFLV